MKFSMILAVTAGLLLAGDEPSDAVKREQKKLEGTWTVYQAEENGKKLDAHRYAAARVTFEGNKIIREGVGAKQVSTYTVDPAKTPKVMDGTDPQGRVSRAIYELDGDTFKMCWTIDKERPTEFVTKEGAGQYLVVFKRLKP